MSQKVRVELPRDTELSKIEWALPRPMLHLSNKFPENQPCGFRAVLLRANRGSDGKRLKRNPLGGYENENKSMYRSTQPNNEKKTKTKPEDYW